MTSEIKNQEAVPKLSLSQTESIEPKTVVNGNMTLPAVPSMLEEYVQMCGGMFNKIGVLDGLKCPNICPYWPKK